MNQKAPSRDKCAQIKLDFNILYIVSNFPISNRHSQRHSSCYQARHHLSDKRTFFWTRTSSGELLEWRLVIPKTWVFLLRVQKGKRRLCWFVVRWEVFWWNGHAPANEYLGWVDSNGGSFTCEKCASFSQFWHVKCRLFFHNLINNTSKQTKNNNINTQNINF